MATFLHSLAQALTPAPAAGASSNTNADPLLDQADTWCKKKFEENRSNFMVFHSLVWQSLLMYAGLLWIRWDRNRKVLYLATPDDNWTPLPNINRFSPAIDSMASAFSMPEIEALPQEEDNIDAHEVAAVANSLADWIVQRAGLEDDFDSQEDKVGLARQLFVLAGSCFTIVEEEDLDVKQFPIKEPKPAWGVQCKQCDSYDKMPVPDESQLAPSTQLMGQTVTPPQPPQMCPNCGGPVSINDTTIQTQKSNPDGTPAMQDAAQYGCKIFVGNPLYAMPMPGSTSMMNARWNAWCERLTIDDIKSRWDIAAEPDQEQMDGTTTTYETQLSYWYSGYASQQSMTRDMALATQFFLKPGDVSDFPEGLYAVMVNKKVQYAKKWADEFPIEDLTITKGGYLKLPTTFFDRTPAFDLMEVQRECSELDALISLHGKTTAADPIVADESTKVSEITGRGDKVIWFKSLGPGSVAPHRMGHGALDPQIYTRLQTLEDKMQNISAAVQVFRGEQPGSVTTASGIAQLRGQAEQMFSVPSANWSGMWKETIRKAVKLMQARMPIEQIVALMGDEHLGAIQKFKNAKLDDVIKWAASRFGLPRTRDEKRQELMSLYDRGALDVNDPNVKQTIFELFGDIGMESQFSLDATRARAENQLLKQGAQLQPLVGIEDLAVHSKIHKEVVKKLDFDNWPQPAKEAILQHIMLTDAALAQQNAPPPMPGAPGQPMPHPTPPNIPGKGAGARPGGGRPQPKGTLPSGAPSAPPAPAAGAPPIPTV
jgi:hypothetical protein